MSRIIDATRREASPLDNMCSKSNTDSSCSTCWMDSSSNVAIFCSSTMSQVGGKPISRLNAFATRLKKLSSVLTSSRCKLPSNWCNVVAAKGRSIVISISLARFAAASSDKAASDKRRMIRSKISPAPFRENVVAKIEWHWTPENSNWR